VGSGTQRFTEIYRDSIITTQSFTGVRLIDWTYITLSLDFGNESSAPKVSLRNRPVTSPWKARTELASFPLDISNLSYLFHILFPHPLHHMCHYNSLHMFISYRANIGFIASQLWVRVSWSDRLFITTGDRRAMSSLQVGTVFFPHRVGEYWAATGNARFQSHTEFRNWILLIEFSKFIACP
jgi:hypothetical protein